MSVRCRIKIGLDDLHHMLQLCLGTQGQVMGIKLIPLPLQVWWNKLRFLTVHMEQWKCFNH